MRQCQRDEGHTPACHASVGASTARVAFAGARSLVLNVSSDFRVKFDIVWTHTCVRTITPQLKLGQPFVGKHGITRVGTDAS